MQEHSHRATPSDSAELRRDLITYLDSGAPGFFLVAEEDNRVVGYADIKYLPHTAAAGYHVQLFDVCITPESSLGGALLDVTKAIATFLGTTTLTAGIPTNHSGTTALLDQAGFCVTSEAIWEFQS